jgi:hypothetical protein
MTGSKKLLLGALAAAAIMANAAAWAHPTGTTGGTMMGQGSAEACGGQGGAMHKQQKEMGANRSMQHHGKHHGMKHGGMKHGGGHGGHAMAASGHKGGGHKGSGHHKRGGMRVTPIQHLTVDDVSHFFRHRLERRGNKRLKLGEVVQRDEDTITAQIVTVDGSLVEVFEVDRHSGKAKRAN